MSNILQNHTVSEVLAKLYLNNERADVNFVFNIDDKIEKVPANKVILASLSPVFDAMFFGALKEGDEVEIVDADVESFKEFLQFFYLNYVTITMENMKTVVCLADKYDILPYVDLSAVFYEYDEMMDDVCWFYQLATCLKNTKLIDFYAEKIGDNLNDVFKSESFLRLNEETLKNTLKIILSVEDDEDSSDDDDSENIEEDGDDENDSNDGDHDDNFANDEDKEDVDDIIHIDAIHACMEWAKYSCKINGLDENRPENLRIQLGDCFKLLNFSRMEIKQFIKFSDAHKGLFNPEEFEDIVYGISLDGYETKIFNQLESAPSVIGAELCDGPKLYVQQLEVITFMPNRSLKLIKIRTTSTLAETNIPNIVGSKFKVIIIERGDCISSKYFKKILYNSWCETWNENQLEVILPRSISTEAEKIYEIRLYVPSIYGYYYQPKNDKDQQTDVVDKLLFHRHPNQGGERSSQWISKLIFEQND